LNSTQFAPPVGAQLGPLVKIYGPERTFCHHVCCALVCDVSLELMMLHTLCSQLLNAYAVSAVFTFLQFVAHKLKI